MQEGKGKERDGRGRERKGREGEGGKGSGRNPCVYLNFPQNSLCVPIYAAQA